MAIAEAKSDKHSDLFAVRSLLFLPASNPRAVAKAREAGADLVILDLEDAVKPEDKNDARNAAVEAVAEAGRCRSRSASTESAREWHSLDLDAAARSKVDYVVVPRAISAHLIRDVAETVGNPSWR